MTTLRAATVRPLSYPVTFPATVPMAKAPAAAKPVFLPKAQPNPFPVKPLDQRNALTVLFGLETRYSRWFKPSSKQSEPLAWPAGMDPKHAPVYARNETFIPGAKASDVFNMLVRASNWQSYYPNAKDVKIEGGGDLKLGSKFTWRTFANDLHSEVTLYEKDKALGWTFKNGGVDGYHRWFVKQEAGGVRLITEEVETGFVPTLSSLVMNRALPAAHQLWVESVKARILGQKLP